MINDTEFTPDSVEDLVSEVDFVLSRRDIGVYGMYMPDLGNITINPYRMTFAEDLELTILHESLHYWYGEVVGNDSICENENFIESEAQTLNKNFPELAGYIMSFFPKLEGFYNRLKREEGL